MSMDAAAKAKLAPAQAEMKAAWNARAEKNAFLYVETQHGEADDQAAFFAVGEERTRLLIDPVLARIGFDKGGKSALDVGCGLGRFTHTLGRRFAKVTGVDVSDVMVAQAKVAAAGAPNLDFVVSDGVTIPVATESVDFVWSYEVFQHMPTHDVIGSTLHEIARVMRRDGYGLLHFRTGHEGGQARHLARFVPDGVVKAVKRAMGKDPHMVGATWHGAPSLEREQIAELCGEAGLQIADYLEDPTHEAGCRAFALVRRA